MVDLCVLAQQLLLALLVSKVSTDLVTVFLGLQEGNQVDASPHLLTGEFAGNLLAIVKLCDGRGGKSYLASRMPWTSLYQP